MSLETALQIIVGSVASPRFEAHATGTVSTLFDRRGYDTPVQVRHVRLRGQPYPGVDLEFEAVIRGSALNR